MHEHNFLQSDQEYSMKKDSTAPIRVLLVDDETAFSTPLAKRLTRRGMDVSTAEDGTDAFAMLETGQIDVVVLDLLMPGINGMQVLKVIKKQFSQVQVIILTGNGRMSDGLKALAAGAYNFLFKPVEIDVLAKLIEEAAASAQTKKPTK